MPSFSSQVHNESQDSLRNTLEGWMSWKQAAAKNEQRKRMRGSIFCPLYLQSIKKDRGREGREGEKDVTKCNGLGKQQKHGLSQSQAFVYIFLL